MEKNEFKKDFIKNHTCFFFDGITAWEDFDLDNILKKEKSNENILIYDISCQTLIQNLCVLDSIK